MVGIGVHLNLCHPLALEHLLQGCVHLLCPRNVETFRFMTGVTVSCGARSAEAASMPVVPASSSDGN